MEVDMLPRGAKTVEDVTLINLIIKDEIYIGSMESEYGKIKNVHADWDQGLVIYEFLNGDMKSSDIDKLLSKLKEINYLAEYAQ
jgi:hypothetical protein